MPRRRTSPNPRSIEANDRVEPWKSEMCERVRLQVLAAGFRGAVNSPDDPDGVKIWDQQKRRFKYAHEISGRFTTLHRAGLIYDSNRPRAGFTVWVGRAEWVTRLHGTVPTEPVQQLLGFPNRPASPRHRDLA